MSHDKNVLKAEVLVTNFLVQHNLPLATADHLGQLFKGAFLDSKLVKSYACAKTKTTAILNEVLAPECNEYIVPQCKVNAYSVGTDGSNDTGVRKMNPVSIRIFDVNRSKTVTNHCFYMCLTEGEHSVKASTIFSVIEDRFAQDMMPWNNCVALSVDNTNGKLLEYFEFCDQEYQSILKHLSVRWLSLECCVSRILKKYPSLKSYFLSEHFADARFQRLDDWFSNPMLEFALLFHIAAMPLFTSFILLLQRDEPTIHILKNSMRSLGANWRTILSSDKS
ncbi:hypothetical protein BSL78_28755 [Apostichopus japonicus]|uniref:Uncharacterized protein n=1 Tax=Stichopus japonicus TaxID=307972 RepID=A0A2G8JFD8_STIJA|nr:hypothetical protein BSL78_28755 [Apostichopus japonicus]